MKTVAQFVHQHPLFAGMESEQVDFIAQCGGLHRFAEGELIARENEPANTFYLLLEGRVAIEVHRPNQPPVSLITLGANEVVGWSWLIPPYRWEFDIRAVTPLRTVQFDGRCLRDKCEADPAMGFDLLRRIMATMAARIQHTRFQLLDIYGDDPIDGDPIKGAPTP